MITASRLISVLRATTGALLFALWLGAASPACAASPAPIRFDIASQPLSTALRSFAAQANMQILYRQDVVQGVTASPVVGSFDKRAALEQLLSGTGLEIVFSSENVATIRMKSGAAAADRGAAAQGIQLARSTVAATSDERGDKRASGTGSSSLPADGDRGGSAVEEIIVTAQKRAERLQEVPVPVAAVSAESLVATNQVRLADYYARIPGVNFMVGTRSDPAIAIRGVTTGPATPTVGITVDDVAYGSSTQLGGGYTIADIDPSDLVRIEVLRGPQGTLYGASSIGGLIKFVTADPSTERFSGRVQAGTESVENGDELGYSLRASVNVPLSDTWAVRASGYTRRNPGYIDNTQTGAEGDNRREGRGGRLSALWRPSQDVSLKLSALYQDNETLGSNLVYVQAPFVQPGFDELQHSVLRRTGIYGTKNQIYSATLTASLGQAELTAASGYSINKVADATDYSTAFGGLANTYFGVGGAAVTNDYKVSKFTQEVRLSGPLGQRFDWLLGAFYTDESTNWGQYIFAANPATGAHAGALLLADWALSFSEYAAFADLTVHFTDRFDVQFGGRESRNRQSFKETLTGPLAGTPPGGRTDASAFTYLVTPRFKISPDLMAYARFASGYRVGGLNAAAGTPVSYGPDKTTNYDVGLKADLLGRALTVDASLYYIDWRDIQLNLLTAGGFTYLGNGGEARSRGAELTIEARPVKGLAIAAWVAWNDAQLTQDFAATSSARGFAGDRLPFSSRASGSFSVTQEFPLTDTLEGFVGGSLSYVGDRVSVFRTQSQSAPGPSLPREVFPAYTKVDLSAGVKLDHSWTVGLFANNVTDERGILQGGLGFRFPFAYEYIQPRTFGLGVTKTF